MRNRRNIRDHRNLKTCYLQRTDGRLTARTGTLYKYFNRLQTMLHCSLSCGFRCHLSSKRRILTGASESQPTCACPRKSITCGIGKGNNCIIKCGLNMRLTLFNILAVTTAHYFLSSSCCSFIMTRE